MRDRELIGKSNEHNDKLMSDFGVTRRQSRSLYRNWALISKKSMGNSFQSQTENVFTKISQSSIGNDVGDFSKESSSTLIEDRADEIVRHMEQSQTLMNNNPKSKNERIETLREMTEYLTIKRTVKRKLTKSIGSTSKTLSFSKRLKYRISIFFSKIPVAIKHFIGSFELWYSSLKVIEGHFGSSVASYFKFLRKLFLLNACIFILILFFILVPQLLFRFIQYVEVPESNNSTLEYSSGTFKSNVTLGLELDYLTEKTKLSREVRLRANPYEENAEFRFGNLFTGEGFLTNTILFYGYFSNTSLQLMEKHSYNIPASYFFTSAVCYILIFFFLFISVAVSYRECYIEASGGMNNTFTNKVFCGWDFGIATKQAAELKSKSIYIEIKELLDDLSKPAKKRTCINTFYTTAISLSLNLILLFLLGVGGMYSWKYLDQQMAKADTATTMMMWLILTLVTAIAPVLFSLIAHLEGFESPSSALYMTLIRTFTLYAVVIAVVVAYRINRSNETECWETILGQDMYRLVVLDFIFGLIGTALSEFIRYRIFVKMWKGIGCPEFDIARSTMNLIYNQTLFYIGLFFSPVLSLIITIKLFLTFYIKKWGAVCNCRPFVKPWKAAQAHTVYLSIAFFAFFSVVVSYGYIITSVKTSNCGPFRGDKYMYETLLQEIANRNSTIVMIFYYITRPGVVGIILMAMGLGVYYMRAVAYARIHVVNHLRNLLRLKAEDRKLLLHEISKYNKTQDRKNDDDKSSPSGEDLQDTGFKNLNRRVSKSKESLSNVEGVYDFNEDGALKRSRIIFSSFINIKSEEEKSTRYRPNRSSIFRSSYVGGPSNEDDLELKYNYTSSKPDTSENSEQIQPSSSEWEESYLEGSTDGYKSPLSSVTSKNLRYVDSKESNEVDAKDLPASQPLNFNPIFTVSFPLPSDDDEEFVDVANSDSTVSRSNPAKPEKNAEVNQSDSTEVKNFPNKYILYEERVPGRISFDSDPDHKILKKKKHR